MSNNTNSKKKRLPLSARIEFVIKTQLCEHCERYSDCNIVKAVQGRIYQDSLSQEERRSYNRCLSGKVCGLNILTPAINTDSHAEVIINSFDMDLLIDDLHCGSCFFRYDCKTIDSYVNQCKSPWNSEEEFRNWYARNILCGCKEHRYKFWDFEFHHSCTPATISNNKNDKSPVKKVKNKTLSKKEVIIQDKRSVKEINEQSNTPEHQKSKMRSASEPDDIYYTMGWKRKVKEEDMQ